MANASADLITALKNSLADGDAGWGVVGVSEAAGTWVGDVSTVSGQFVNGSHSEFGTPVLDYGEAVTSVTANSATTVVTSIRLSAPSLRVGVGSTTPMAMVYQSVWIDASYSHGFILADGAQLKTADSALDTTIRGLATTFLTAKDASLKNALVAGPVSPEEDPLLIPLAFLTALKASLSDDDAGWVARSRSSFQQSADTTRVIISIAAPMVDLDGKGNFSPYVRLTPNSSAPANFSYEALYNAVGDLLEAAVRFNSAYWRTGLDAELDEIVVALGDDFLEAQAESLTAALTAGPQ